MPNDNGDNGDDQAVKKDQVDSSDNDGADAGGKGGDAGDKGKDGDKTVSVHALHEEREKHKETKAELEKYRKAEQEAKEAKMAEEGKYKELITEKDTKISELEKQLADKTTLADDLETAANNRIEESLKSIESEEDRKLATDLLDGKSTAQKDALLPGLLQRFGATGGKGFNQPPGNDGKGGKTTNADEIRAKYEEAKKKGDTQAILAAQREARKNNITL